MYIYIHLSLPFATYSRGGEARSLSSSDGGSCDPVERVFFIKSLSGVPYTRTYFLNYFTFLLPSSSSSFFFYFTRAHGVSLRGVVRPADVASPLVSPWIALLLVVNDFDDGHSRAVSHRGRVDAACRDKDVITGD